MNMAFSEVGESSFLGLTIPGEDDGICSEYDNYTIPLYEYLLSTIGVCMPFTAFEVDVFNFLMTAISFLELGVRKGISILI